MRIEHSRKHGPFDPRYSPIPHDPAPASLWRPGEGLLDWQGFLTRFFPGSRRHDFAVLAAYESYRNHVESRREGVSAPVLAGSSSAAQRGEDEDEPPATTDTDRWESDGGASAARPPRRRTHERPVGTRKV